MTDGTPRQAPEIPDIELGHRDEVADDLEARGDWAALVTHLRARLEADTERSRDIAHRLSDVLEEQLHEPRQAADVLLGLLERMPGDADALKELERLYGDMEDWAGLITAYRHGVEATTDVFEKTSLLDKIRLIQEEALRDPGAVRATCVEAMALHPRCDWAWTALMISHSQDESWWELIRELTQVAMHAGELVGMITLRIAALMDERLDQPDKAIELYEAALSEGANPQDALHGLEGLYTDTENWEGLIHTYQRLAPQIRDPEELLNLKRNWAMVLADGLGDVDGAIAIYDALLEADPDDKASFQARHVLKERPR